MYLKQLTLKGFKSFAQPTTFVFEPGVTCVIGPNGSGKSNIVDALAWVMGEQGAKSLRGGTMEDVIFAGTATRGPLGRAEVRLTIDNTDGALPIEYSEVTISRTLFRNGGSEYAINGESCRLLDVQELLSDSGLGREMHVIVGQGQLDSLLHATPEGRRGFIEEAAGILKHRRRKEKTLRKLEAMQANLTRLSDLAGEVRRQLKPLGRQAELAREAQSVAAVARDARARLLADDVVAVRRVLDERTREEADQHSEHIVLQAQLEQKVLFRERLEKTSASVRVDSARQTLFSLEQARDRLRSLLTLSTQRLALLSAQPDLAFDRFGVTPQQISDSTNEIVRLSAVVAESEALFQNLTTATTQERVRLDALDEEISAQSVLVSQHDLEISVLVGRAESAAQNLALIRGEVLRQENSRDAAAQRRSTALSELHEQESDAEAFGSTREGLSEAYELAQSEVFDAEAASDVLREEFHALERERDALRAREQVLSRALDQKDGVGALIGAKASGVLGRVAEQIHVQPGCEIAISAALGTLADAVLVETREDGLTALTRARSEELGQISVIIASEDVFTAGLSNIPGVTLASTLVKGPPALLALLGNSVIADDLESARRAYDFCSTQPEGSTLLNSLTVITRQGDVLSKRVLRGGSAAHQSRIELHADREEAVSRLSQVEKLLVTTGASLAEQRGALASAKERSTACLTALRNYDSSSAARSEALNRARGQFEAASAECDRLAAALEQASERVTEAEHIAETARAQAESARSRPRPILDASARERMSSELDAARERELSGRLGVETARERLRAEQERNRALTEQLESDRQAAAEAARRSKLRRQQSEAAKTVCDALQPVLQSADLSVSEAQSELATAQNERTLQSDQLESVRREEAALRERLVVITEAVHGVELQIYEKKLQLSSLLERAGSDLGLVEDVLIAEYGPDVAVPSRAISEISEATVDGFTDEPETVPFDREEQRQRLAIAERALAQLGRINPLALEEFAALEQRHAFLAEQLTDLTNTRADLLTIIDDVDEKMQSIFLDAFEDTKEAFSTVFPILFPGGTGSITLTDPDNPLTTGIEVSVKPAGKKIERLSLLSGGERSLAALAFLVAIFTARPSPFYIMDEVEAALDDANLGRLLTIFTRLRESSQLIVITHQKRTMEIADSLYGVSMGNDGVSAVIGQRVHDPEA